MKYAEARALIKTGDLIAIKGNSLLSKLTQFFTHGPHSHTGVAIWFGDRLCMSELNGGRNHFVPISHLAKLKFDVHEGPKVLPGMMHKSIIEMMEEPVEYSEVGFITIGLISWLKLKVKLPWRDKQVCSVYSMAIYGKAGWEEPVRLISPTALTKLLPYKFSVEP